MSDEKPKQPKFKWTKELINIALNDGMTQDDIARVCRTQQSVVSSWKNGKNKATEQQLAELLRRYGARLNRTTARLYLVREEPTRTWQETEIGQRLLALQKRQADQSKEQIWNAVQLRTDERRQEIAKPHISAARSISLEAPRVAEHAQLQKEIYPYINEYLSIEKLIYEYQYKYNNDDFCKLVQIEGKVIFRYTFLRPCRRDRAKGWEVGREQIARWVIHDMQRGNLLLVTQERRVLSSTSFQRQDENIRSLDDRARSFRIPDWIDSPDDTGRWLSRMTPAMSVEAILELVDNYIRDPTTLHSPHDEQVLPFLIRKALLEHGHPVPGIDRITGSD